MRYVHTCSTSIVIALYVERVSKELSWSCCMQYLLLSVDRESENRRALNPSTVYMYNIMS